MLSWSIIRSLMSCADSGNPICKWIWCWLTIILQLSWLSLWRKTCLHWFLYKNWSKTNHSRSNWRASNWNLLNQKNSLIDLIISERLSIMSCLNSHKLLLFETIFTLQKSTHISKLKRICQINEIWINSISFSDSCSRTSTFIWSTRRISSESA